MKKLLFIALILFAIGLPLSAVDFTLGPKASFGDYSYWGSDWKDAKDLHGYINYFSPSFSAGVFFITHFSTLFSVQVDGLYASQTYQFGQSSSDWDQYGYSSIALPVYARFDFQTGSVNIFVMAGPRFDILFDKIKIKYSDGSSSEDSIKDSNLNSFMVGLSLGAGVSFTAGPGKMEIGAVYNTVFTKLDPDADLFNNGIELQLGYGFAL